MMVFGGTNRKVVISRLKTYIGGGTQWQSVKTSNYTASAGEGVFMNTTSGALTLTLFPIQLVLVMKFHLWITQEHLILII